MLAMCLERASYVCDFSFYFSPAQVDKIKKDIEAQSSQKAALEYRANDAEKKVEVLNEKLNTVSA